MKDHDEGVDSEKGNEEVHDEEEEEVVVLEEDEGGEKVGRNVKDHVV